MLASLWFLPCAELTAQSVHPFPIQLQGASVDSGFIDGATSRRRVVFRKKLRSGGANSLRVHFGSTNLPKGSELRLTGSSDGAVQRFDGRSLHDWSSASAVFNGDAVLLELIAGPGSRANRVVVQQLEIGLAVPLVPTDDLCGPDGRVPTQDPRVGRQYPYGCTVWLANEFTVVTAGHCTNDPNQQVHFNVPPSSSTGIPRFPPPSDQYPFEVPTLARLDAGPGADWSVARAVANSTTGLYPGQAQGGWFELGPIPASTNAGVTVTGYGVVSDPARMTLSQTEQRDSATLLSITPTELHHGADTTAASSGSPVIHSVTGRAIGIHTHGNCAFTGNIATRIDRADLSQALAATRSSKILGQVRRFGQGCSTSAGVLRLDCQGYPAIGHTSRLEVGPLPNGGMAAVSFGASDQLWAGLPLPVAVPGVPGCSVLISLDWNAWTTVTGSQGGWLWTIPANPTLVGLSLGVQGFAFEPVGAGFTAATSDALWVTVGRDS